MQLVLLLEINLDFNSWISWFVYDDFFDYLILMGFMKVYHLAMLAKEKCITELHT